MNTKRNVLRILNGMRVKFSQQLHAHNFRNEKSIKILPGTSNIYLYTNKSRDSYALILKSNFKMVENHLNIPRGSLVGGSWTLTPGVRKNILCSTRGSSSCRHNITSTSILKAYKIQDLRSSSEQAFSLKLRLFLLCKK
jgi:hypothetical protein